VLAGSKYPNTPLCTLRDGILKEYRQGKQESEHRLASTSRSLFQGQRIRPLLTLILGDTLAFLVFAAIGRSSHVEAAGLNAIPQIVETAAPFLIGWAIAAPFVGAYRVELLTSAKGMLARTAMAWLLAWPLGLGLRALIRQSSIPISFALVTFIAVLLIICVWRLAYLLIRSRATQRSV
jgi:Protein of unknown function (DUF3054)